MINPDDVNGIEDAWQAALEAVNAQEICLTDKVAALAQALGFALERATDRGLTENVSAAELAELVDRYKRRGAVLEQAISKHEGKTNGN